jgi:peptide/nickel transport system permease protein
MGEDILSQVIRGTTISMEIGLISAAISIGVGVTVGILAGYYRGVLEQFLLAVTDAFIIIPSLPLTIVLIAYTEPTSTIIIFAISVLAWCPMARVVHPRVASIMNSPFVLASKMLGKSDSYILVNHIIPNCWNIISAKFALAVGAGMLAEASLSFIGLGDRFSISWGTIVNQAFRQGALFMGYWWWYLIPGLMICIAVLAFLMLTYSNTDDTGVVE